MRSRPPVSTFSAKILLSYALGLLTKAERRQLDLIRKIRNECAHAWGHATFSTQSIRSRVQELPDHAFRLSSAADPVRQRFETAASVLLHNLDHRLQVKRADPPAPACAYPIDEEGVMVVPIRTPVGQPIRDPWIESTRALRKAERVEPSASDKPTNNG